MSSNPKEILFEEEARIKLLQGIEELAKAASVTLGPKGRNVALEAYGNPEITNDGNSIVKEVELKDTFANMGVSLGKEVAEKIKEKCGDGTTTGIVILHNIVKNSVKNILAGASPIAIKRGMDKTMQALLLEIERMSISVESDKDMQNIATVSASGNKEVGEKISQCFQKVGKSGVITIEEAKGIETTITLVEGLEFENGYISPYFCTDPEKMLTEMNDPYILITDKKISSIQEIVPLLQTISSTGKELLIISDTIEGDALSGLVINKLRQTLKVAAVKAPSFGDQRKEILEDIAILTNGTYITEEKGLSLKDVVIEDLGQAEKVLITKEKTLLIKGKGQEEQIKSRIAQIDGQMQNTDNTYDKEKLNKRKAKLSGGVALLCVGAATESELKQKKQIFEDSLHSTRSALEEGVVCGGGIALLQAAKNIKNSLKLSNEENIGKNILLQACQAPCKQIISNTGYSPSIFIDEIEKSDKNMGFNAETEKVEDLIQCGVIDPVKVVKNSLIHAVSVAGVIAISEALIADYPEEKN